MLTWTREVRADVIRKFHERPTEMAEVLIALEEWGCARQSIIEELGESED